MSSRALAAIICAFVPCSGFLRPTHPGAPAATGVPTLQSRTKAIMRQQPRLGLLRPCGGLSGGDEGGNRHGASREEPRHRRRLPLHMVNGGDGGYEMEGEVEEGESLRTEAAHGDSPKGRPKPDDVIEGPRGNGDGAPTRLDASGSTRGQDGEEGATVGGMGGLGAELRGRAVATSSSSSEEEEEAGTGSVVAAGEGGARSERQREAPLTERIGFESIRKLLPEGGEGLEMDVARLRRLRSEITKLKRNMHGALESDEYKGAGEMKKEIAALRTKDPLYVVSEMLGDAISREKFKRAAKLKEAKDWLLRESHGSTSYTNRLVCLGDRASNVITTDTEGSAVHRFLANEQVREIMKTGQIQLPVWSPDGRMLAFTVLKVGGASAPIQSARILVYRDGGGLELDVSVPRAPFLLMWSPNSQSLTYLSNSEGPDGPTIRLAEVLVAAAKTPFKTKSRSLAQGSPLFYAFTKKSPQNANMVVHTGSRVYFLDMTTGNEVDISTAETPLFMAPSTHCVGGEDSVIVVEGSSDEGQHLVSVRVDGSAKKRLCPTRGFSMFCVSPDGNRLCLMQQDLSTEFYTISVMEGREDALDPRSTATMEQVEIPLDRVVMAFFFSPDSRKLLCLATKMSKNELAVARSSMRLGFQLKFQWVIYDCEARSVQLLEEFSPRQFFLKMYLPYFDMFAQGFTPWSPDASAFAYVAEKAAFIQEVPDEGLAPLPRELGPNMEFVSWSFC